MTVNVEHQSAVLSLCVGRSINLEHGNAAVDLLGGGCSTWNKSNAAAASISLVGGPSVVAVGITDIEYTTEYARIDLTCKTSREAVVTIKAIKDDLSEVESSPSQSGTDHTVLILMETTGEDVDLWIKADATKDPDRPWTFLGSVYVPGRFDPEGSGTFPAQVG